VKDVAYAAQGFDDRTRHFATWTRTLGRSGWAAYLFLLQQDVPVAHSTLRTQFSEAPITALQSTLDALLYHGLIHCHGRGRRQQYSIAGKMYRDWFLSAGKLSAPEQSETLKAPGSIQVLIESLEQHIGAQTNIAGDAKGPVASGKFESATAFGEGDAKDCRGQEGD